MVSERSQERNIIRLEPCAAVYGFFVRVRCLFSEAGIPSDRFLTEVGQPNRSNIDVSQPPHLSGIGL